MKGTIPILRQQKDWVGGFRKLTVLLTFGTVFMLTYSPSQSAPTILVDQVYLIFL